MKELKKRKINNYDYIKSASSDYCISGDLESTIGWINKIKKSVDVKIRKVDLIPLDKWVFNREESLIKHASGGFYSIQGLRVLSNINPIKSWDQPIINQNEIGYLGFLVKRFNGVLQLHRGGI